MTLAWTHPPVLMHVDKPRTKRKKERDRLMIAQISCIYSVIGKIKCVKGTDGLARVKKRPL